MNNILNKICSEKIKEVEFQRRKVTEKELLLLINNTEKPRKFKNRINLFNRYCFYNTSF